MRKLRCGILTGYTNPGIDTLLAVSDYEFSEISSVIEDYRLPKNYKLPEAREFDIAFVEDSIFQVFEKRYPGKYNRLIGQIRRLARRNVVVAIAGRDWFQMANPPHAYEEFDLILKTSGVFKDKDLYNYVNGACSTNRDWLSKVQPLAEKYPKRILDKLRPSYPDFISTHRIVRRRVRRLLPHLSILYGLAAAAGDIVADVENALETLLGRAPKKFLHCVCGVTHYQRIEVMRLLRSLDFSGDQWLTPFKDDFLWEFGRRPLSPEEKDSVRKTCEEEGLVGKRVGRIAFKRNMRGHRVILAPTGYGEITYRHAEAWQMKRTLVCQDLSHVDILYPLEDGANVVYCRSDFSDLREKLEGLRENEALTSAIAREGHRRWREWSRPEMVFEVAVTRYVNALLSAGAEN